MQILKHRGILDVPTFVVLLLLIAMSTELLLGFAQDT